MTLKVGDKVYWNDPVGLTSRNDIIYSIDYENETAFISEGETEVYIVEIEKDLIVKFKPEDIVWQDVHVLQDLVSNGYDNSGTIQIIIDNISVALKEQR